MGTPVISYVPCDNVGGAPAYSATGTFATSAGVYPPLPFGQEVRFKDVQTGSGNAGGAVAVFVQGNNVSSAGQFVQIINNSAVLLTNGNSASYFPIGIAGGAMTATNVWGWVGIEGKFDNGAYTNVQAASAAPARAYLPKGTAGQIQTAGTSNEYLEIRGIHFPVSYTSTDGSATQLGYRALTVQLDRPTMLGRSATNAAW
jgi:hypothetical protein